MNKNLSSQANAPLNRRIFRHTALKFFAMHKALRKILPCLTKNIARFISTSLVKTGSKKRITQITLIILGIVLLTIGIIRGEQSEIMRKATIVCLECIGLA